MDNDSDGGASTSTLEISQPETQFIPQEDDEEILWEVIEITAEKGKRYRVRWAGADPKTRKPWPQSWVPMHDCTDDLVLAWKRKQALKKKEAERKKSAKRGSTSSKKSRGSAISRSTVATSRGGSAASSNTVGTKSRTRSNVTATPQAGPSNSKSLSHSPSKLASISTHKPPVTVNSNGKRKLSSPPPLSHSLSSDEDSLPEISTLTETRPRKKRKVEVEAVAASELDPGISQESYQIRMAGIRKQGKVLPIKEEEEEDEDEDEVKQKEEVDEGEDEVEEVEEERNKAKSSRAQGRFNNKVSKKQVPPIPRLDKGKGRAVPTPSSSEDEQDQLLPTPKPLPTSSRAPAAPPSQPTAKELEVRKALAIAKKKSQLAQASLRDGQLSVDGQRAVKGATSSKSISKSSAIKTVAGTSTVASRRENKRKIIYSDDDDDTRSDTDYDVPPVHKKPAPRPARPRVDLRRVPPKPKPYPKLAQITTTKPARELATTGPLLSPNALAQLREFDKWATESERRAQGSRIPHTHVKEKEKEKEKGDDRPIPAPLFGDGDEEMRKMYDEFVDFDGNVDGGVGGHSPAPAHTARVDPAAVPVPQRQQPAVSPFSRSMNGNSKPRQPRQPTPPSPSPQIAKPQITSTRTGSTVHAPRDDSYRQGIVPETETEESSNNTQSQSQSQPQPQALKRTIESSPVPTSTFPELSVVDNGPNEGVRPGGSGRTEEVVASKKAGPIEAEDTLPDLNPKASRSRSGSGLQRNGTTTPKLVSRMKPRTPGSLAKLSDGGVGVNGMGKGKGRAPLLPLVLEDEHHLYMHHEDDFEGGMEELVRSNGGGVDADLDVPASPLQERSKHASIVEVKSLTASKDDDIPQASSSPPANKLLRPIPLLSPSTFTPHLPPTSSISNVEAEVEGDREEREVEELMSSIEQFSSPEKGGVKRKEKQKQKQKQKQRRRHNGLRVVKRTSESSDDDEDESLPPILSLDEDEEESESDRVGDEGENKDRDRDRDEDVGGDEDEEFAATVRKRGVEMAEQVRRERERREREEGRRAPKTKNIIQVIEKEVVVRAEKAEERTKANEEEKEKEGGSDKDKDNGSSRRQDGGWFSTALRTWPLGIRGSSTVVSRQTSAEVHDTGAANEKAKEGKQAGNAMAIDEKIIELREEEEESTQDLVMEAQEQQGRGRGRMGEGDVEMGWDFVVQKGGEEQVQDREQLEEEPETQPEPAPEPEPEPEQMVEDVQEAPHPTMVDEEPQHKEDTAHRPSSRASSKSKSKAGSDRLALEELDLVLPPTASTYNHTPEPSPESPMKDGPVHLEAAMVLLNAKSAEIEVLEAKLVAKHTKTEELSNEVDALRAALVTASSGPVPRQSNVGLELTEARQALDQEKATWTTERDTLLAMIEDLKRAKQSAQDDCDFFRKQYGQASAFVSSVRKENVELEERAQTAEERAKSGVELVKATFMQRVQWLEDDARTWRTTAQHLVEMDKRTRGEELRKRAGEAPELRKKSDDLEEKNEALCERLEELEDELDGKIRDEQAKKMLEEELLHARREDELVRQMELERWRTETLRLNVELNEMRMEMEMMRADAGNGKQASLGDHELVYRCQWRPEGSSDACEGLFLSVEELQNHLFSGGHLHR